MGEQERLGISKLGHGSILGWKRALLPLPPPTAPMTAAHLGQAGYLPPRDSIHVLFAPLCGEVECFVVEGGRLLCLVQRYAAVVTTCLGRPRKIR